jgi:hypothetical protein
MKPRPWVQLQAAGALLVTVANLALFGRSASLGLLIPLVIALAIWLALIFTYMRRLSESGELRSSWRAAEDTVMLGCLTAGIVVPCALALASRAGIEPLRLVSDLPGSGEFLLAICSLVFAISLLVSSATDWYLIRAFREGVHGDPICNPELRRSGRGMTYATYWIFHPHDRRGLAYLCTVLVGLTIAAESTSNESSGELHQSGRRPRYRRLGNPGSDQAPRRSRIRPPAHLQSRQLGQGQNQQGADISGFVLDVSVKPGVQLIEEPRGHPALDLSDPKHSVPLTQRETIDEVDPPRLPCPDGRCEFWVPNCEHGLRELDQLESR